MAPSREDVRVAQAWGTNPPAVPSPHRKALVEAECCPSICPRAEWASFRVYHTSLQKKRSGSASDRGQCWNHGFVPKGSNLQKTLRGRFDIRGRPAAILVGRMDKSSRSIAELEVERRRPCPKENKTYANSCRHVIPYPDSGSQSGPFASAVDRSQAAARPSRFSASPPEYTVSIVFTGMSELKIPEAGRFERSREASPKQAASPGRFLDLARNDVLDFRDFEFDSAPKELA